jgi:hypothetical protein
MGGSHGTDLKGDDGSFGAECHVTIQRLSRRKRFGGSELWVSIFKRQTGTQLGLCIEFLKQVIDDLVSK